MLVVPDKYAPGALVTQLSSQTWQAYDDAAAAVPRLEPTLPSEARAMTEHLEIEQKFDVDTGFERPSFDGLDGVSAAEPVLHQLSATYFDTADGRLAASKITLRRRTGGTDEGWHLKLPAGAGARREVHAPLDAVRAGGAR